MFPSSTLPLSWIILSMIIVILSTATLFRRKQDQFDHRRKGPPGPPALPVIGNLHMLGNLPHRTLQALSKRYGPIMCLRLGQVPTIVVSSSEAAELFLKTHDTSFASRPKLEASKYLSYEYKGMIFAEYGPYWRNMRKVSTLQLLSTIKVESFAELRKREVQATLESVAKAASAGEVVNVSEVVEGLLEDIVCKMVLGRNMDDEFDLKGIIQESVILAGKFNLADFVPWLAPFDLQGLRRSFKKTSKVVDQVLEKIIKEHEQGPNVQKDYVDILLSMMHQPIDSSDEQSHVIDRTNIKAILLDMIAASSETSATFILWGLSELLMHPRVMKNLQEELATVVGMNKLVQESDLTKLSYLDMVIKETVRLYPAAPFIVRNSIEDTTVQGYHIKRNSRTLINLWAIGRDPKVWSDNAHVFYPERFVNNDVDIRGYDFRLIPFGSGRRGCPGMQLGLAIVKLVVAQLVHCFNWELPFGMNPEELDMNEQFGITMPRAKPLLAVPTCRHSMIQRD